jgi:hypothetical protein
MQSFSAADSRVDAHSRTEMAEGRRDELPAIRNDLAEVMENLSVLAARIGKLSVAQQFDAGGLQSPTAEATSYFAGVRHMNRLCIRHFGEAGFSSRGWAIVLEMMIARLANTTLDEADLLRRTECDAGQLQPELRQLIDEGRVEIFPDPDQPTVLRYCLSGETARRLIEFFRARKTA